MLPWSCQPPLQSLRDVALASLMGVNAVRCCRISCAVLHPSKTFPPGAFCSTPRESLICPRTPVTVTFQAHFRSRWYCSTTVPSSLSAEVMRTDAQRAHPTETKGQSSRRYKTEVLRDNGSLLGRVFLATCVIPNRAGMVS